MSINDDETTTVAEKIKQLRKLCKQYGRKLIVKK